MSARSVRLALSELGQPRLERPLPTVEVGGPRRQPPLEPLLDSRYRFGELGPGLIRLPRNQVPALDGQLALLLSQQVAGGGALAGEDHFLLCGPLARMLLEVRLQAGATQVGRGLVVLQAPQAAAEENEADLGHRGCEEPARGEQERRVSDPSPGGVETEHDAGDDGAEREENRERDEDALGAAVEHESRERQADDGKAGREEDLERRSHQGILWSLAQDGALVRGLPSGASERLEPPKRGLRHSPGENVGAGLRYAVPVPGHDGGDERPAGPVDDARVMARRRDPARLVRHRDGVVADEAVELPRGRPSGRAGT